MGEDYKAEGEGESKREGEGEGEGEGEVEGYFERIRKIWFGSIFVDATSKWKQDKT